MFGLVWVCQADDCTARQCLGCIAYGGSALVSLRALAVATAHHMLENLYTEVYMYLTCTYTFVLNCLQFGT